MVASMSPRDLLQPLVNDKTLKGSTPTFYREQALRRILALASCTPRIPAPSLVAVQPIVGNSAIVYSCPVAPAYSCRTGTAVSNASTAPAEAAVRSPMFGAAAADVTYAQLLAASPVFRPAAPEPGKPMRDKTMKPTTSNKQSGFPWPKWPL